MRMLSVMGCVALGAAGAFGVTPVSQQIPELERELVRTEIVVPDVLGMRMLKCDFHMHTMFSDGVVWPGVRVMEAWATGLDVIAITDHVENHPRREFMGGDDNSSYIIAEPVAQQYDMLLIKGSEITRDDPEGHCNALFVTDSNALDAPTYMEAVEAAIKQGALIQWNHPSLDEAQADSAELPSLQKQLLEKGWLHAIEVSNGSTYYPASLRWCMTKNLAVMSNSDEHGLTMASYDLTRVRRPMTLVLAKERSLAAVKEAVQAGRTVSWFGTHVAGKAEYLEPLLQASIAMRGPHFVDKRGNRFVEITNRTDFTIVLQGRSDAFAEKATLQPHSTQILRVGPGADTLAVEILNWHVNAEQVLTTTLPAGK